MWKKHIFGTQLFTSKIALLVYHCNIAVVLFVKVLVYSPQTYWNITPEIIVGPMTTVYILLDSPKTLSMTVHKQVKMRSATVSTLGAASRQEIHGHGTNNHNSYCYAVWQQSILKQPCDSCHAVASETSTSRLSFEQTVTGQAEGACSKHR